MADLPAPDQQLCFQLYSASRAVTAIYRPRLDELGITYPQYLVLLSLWERDGRTVRDLGEELALDSGTLSPLLKRLEAVGLVERSRSTADERRVQIRLTERGNALREQACELPREILDATGLSLEEAIALRDTLARMRRAMDTRIESGRNRS
ncbi:MarR family winged helix-turn-helix transcriptional regulator [Nocardia farcinica]|uniref:MarR family winged helix-turn-helix transcriptional regulator n=1 Tax=Nocardia farcinica TaxID=37329 RepID=UPI0024573D37|nr:MarR family transcriptional regulator [Nocardia farcinica]